MTICQVIIEFEIGGHTIIYRLYQLILPIALLLSLISFRRGTNDFIISSFLFICVITELIVNKFFSYYFNNNAISNNIYVIIINWFYFQFFKDNNLLKPKYIALTANTFAIISIFYVFYFDLNVLHTVPFLMGLTLVTTLICFYLFNLIHKTNNLVELLDSPKFWLGTGIIIFTATNFPILLHLEEIRYNLKLSKPLFNVVRLSNIILSISYLMYVICRLRRKLY